MKSKPTILYVDDEELNRLIFRINFCKKYEIFIASDANEGLILLDKEKKISIIVSDLGMPGLNGIQFIEKAKEKYPLKKYFILTGYDMNSEIQTSLDNGLILKYFQKPMNVKEIETEIDKYIKL